MYGYMVYIMTCSVLYNHHEMGQIMSWHPLVCQLFISALYFQIFWKDFLETWVKCLPYKDDMTNSYFKVLLRGGSLEDNISFPLHITKMSRFLLESLCKNKATSGDVQTNRTINPG